MTLTDQILSQIPGNPLVGLQRADALWASYRQNRVEVRDVVYSSAERLEQTDWDVAISGGTLGILIGAALAQQGWSVALIERGALRGREQEWNISRSELQVLLRLNLLTPEELDRAIASEYNPARIYFEGGVELWVKDVLNVGVDPVVLLEQLKAKFLAAGGTLLEHTAFESVTVHPNGVAVQAGQRLTARLLLDGMGHFSPIAQQARQGTAPDGVCLVVGTCAEGFPANPTGDLFASITPLQNQCQYFWEAFPARDGRTTYLFTYVDAHPDRPSLADLFEDYFTLLPGYQGVELEQLRFKRSLFGFFPCYRQSPLRPQWDRIAHIGDSSGNQSPLSFGGFGAMLRHLDRLATGLDSALRADVLDRKALALLQPYQPNLSVTWLFQRSMSVAVDQAIAPQQINQLLSAVFVAMDQLGEPVLKPFLQDVVQFPALFQTLMRTSILHPGLVLKIIPQVGVATLIDWLRHYVNLGLYSGLYSSLSAGRNAGTPSVMSWMQKISPARQYYLQRWLEALRYGSGNDYHSE